MTLAALSLPSILLGMRSWQEIVAVAGLIGLWGLFVIYREKWRMYRTRGWPTSPGIVGNIRSRKVSGGKDGVDYWKVTFDYTYKVEREHTNSYSFNCVTENLADRASAGLKDKTVSVHYKPSDENKTILWKDEVWNIW
ncbi:MAG: hypothetical protein ABSA42_13150 [Terracidiphilus sp.]|jgi:hypothetical protein